jgi:septin family protein
MIKIYKLIYNNEIVYVGKTKQKYLSNRKAQGYTNTVPFFKECTIELIEQTDDVSRERYWIERLRSEGHPLLNKRAGDGISDYKEYHKEWMEKNKEYQKEYQREYHKGWREKNKEYQRKYYEKKKLEKLTFKDL